MANPTPEQMTAIAAHVADWTPTDAQIAATLNGLTQPNPVPCGTVGRTIYSADVMAMLSPESLAKVSRNTAFPQIRDDIKAGRKPEMLEWAQFSAGCGDITVAEAQAIVAYILTPVPDPAWQATVPLMPRLIGRDVDAEDVAATRSTL